MREIYKMNLALLKNLEVYVQPKIFFLGIDT
jgi:hypothetical protein